MQNRKTASAALLCLRVHSGPFGVRQQKHKPQSRVQIYSCILRQVGSVGKERGACRIRTSLYPGKDRKDVGAAVKRQERGFSPGYSLEFKSRFGSWQPRTNGKTKEIRCVYWESQTQTLRCT